MKVFAIKLFLWFIGCIDRNEKEKYLQLKNEDGGYVQIMDTMGCISI